MRSTDRGLSPGTPCAAIFAGARIRRPATFLALAPDGSHAWVRDERTGGQRLVALAGIKRRRRLRAPRSAAA